MSEKKASPFKFLLESSGGALGQFQLAKQGEVADLRHGRRKNLTNLRSAVLALFERIEEEFRSQDALFDRIVDVAAQALLAAWLRTIDRQELVRQLLERPTVTIDVIMAEVSALIRDAGRSPEESEAYSMRLFPPGVAHRNASKRYQAANIAEGKCEKCPNPQDSNSSRYCTKHLAIERERDRERREKKGVQIGTHGQQAGTLASLEKNRQKKTKALLAERGLPLDSVAVGVKAALAALLAVMPDKAHAMTQAQLFEIAGIVTKTTGQKALAQLLYTGEIRRTGKGGPLDPYRYFKSGEEPTQTRKPKLSRTKQNSALLATMRGEEASEE